MIHSTAFRRLQYKTQVFIVHEGDHYRTRLTHTLEVGQIARALARQFGLNEDLTETLALAHDLGHPPYGHAGEHALDECLREAGGFDHNAQTLRILTALEHRYPGFDGLNLTWETLEGVVKHNGPLTDRAGAPVGRYTERGVPAGILAYAARHDLQLWGFASLEAQVAAIADDIAYDAHDIDDGLRAGLFTIDDLKALPGLDGIITAIDARYPGLDQVRRGAELVRELISALIDAVVEETASRLAEVAPRSSEDVRDVGRVLVGFSRQGAQMEAGIKTFLFERMYRHPRVVRIMSDAESIVRDLFWHYLHTPGDLPAEWRRPAADKGEITLHIGDFIAGMTDRFALMEHARLFDSTPDLR